MKKLERLINTVLTLPLILGVTMSRGISLDLYRTPSIYDNHIGEKDGLYRRDRTCGKSFPSPHHYRKRY